MRLIALLNHLYTMETIQHKMRILEQPGPSADEALARLVAGNQRFHQGVTRPAGLQRETLADLARGQKPNATILGCSDSRVPSEQVFDAGLGELFMVRVAGNMFSPEVTGSLQYAGSHLETPLFVVLGHDGCGGGRCRPDHQLRGRTALLADSDPGGRHPARAAGVRPGLSPQVRLARVVECNVLWTVRQILSTPEG